MAAPTYATDLVDISTCEAAGTWTEPTATGWTSGAAPGVDAENYIQQANAISKAFNATGVGGMIFNFASNVTFGTNAAFFCWCYWASPQTLDTEANGGMRLLVGNDGANFKAWKVRGKDSYPYGGWVNEAVDPVNVTADYTAGAPTTTRQWFGMCVNNLNAITKGSPCLVDVLRVGRELRVTGGDLANGYATFLGAAAKNDANDATNGYNRWGLFQDVGGSYLHKGLFVMGLAATAVDFRDSNRTIAIQNTKKVAAAFNAFEIRNASSRVDWTNITISALGTVSRGTFTVTDNATVNLTSCSFSGMSTFSFLGNTTVSGTSFRGCEQITQGGSTITGCTISKSTSAVSLLVDDMSRITNNKFESDGSNHAIQINSGTTHSFSGNTFTGYASSNGSTGNEAVFINIAAGTVTLNISSGDVPSYRTAGATIVINASKNVTLTGLQTGSEVRAYLGTNPATATEIGGVEDSGTSFTFAQSYAGQAGYIVVHALGYLSIKIDLTYSGVDQSIPIQQQVDRQYLNP